MSPEDPTIKRKESIIHRIAQDVEHENEIIISHKTRQSKIIEQISNFKQKMKLQIIQLEQQIGEAEQKNINLSKNKCEKYALNVKTIKDLETQITVLQKKNLEAHNRNNDNTAANHAELETLMSNIQVKTENISTMTTKRGERNIFCESLNTKHSSEIAAKEKLVQDCTAIESSIAIEKKNDEDIAKMETEHTRKILLEIEALKVKTDEMQIQLMTSGGVLK